MIHSLFMNKSRNWIFTWNNYNDESIIVLAAVPCRYLVYGKEVAPTTGTPHLQGFIIFHNPRALGGVRSVLPLCHVERARGTPDQCRTYCIKDGDFTERGSKPVSSVESGNRERARWITALEAARGGDFDRIDAQILICHLTNLQRIQDLHVDLPETLPTTTGIWIFGPSGCGKSRGCRIAYPDLFPKPLNKWWDGYTNQSVVLLDDVDPTHGPWIGSFLKIWADHYPFIAERKGRSGPIRPKRLLVTSQYTIDQVFLSGGREIVEAITRRFTIIEITADQQIAFPEM